MKKKISIVAISLSGGGAEKVAVNLANHFVTNGQQVEIILFNKTGPYLKDVNPAIPVIDLNVKHRRFVFRMNAIFPLYRYLKSSKPDVVLSMMRNSNIIAGLAAYLLPELHLVVREANTMDTVKQMSGMKKSFMLLLMKLSYSKAGKIIANSSDTLKDLEDLVIKGKSVIISNPVLPPDYRKLSEVKPNDEWLNDPYLKVIMGIGRLEEQKDFPALIKIFHQVQKTEPQARLMILGEGKLLGSLEQLIKQLDLETKVRIVGFKENIFSYLKNAKVFAMTSKWEGFGNVIVEALAAGTPVVSFDCPGGPATILDKGRYGALVPPGNLNEFADQILKELSKSSSTSHLVDRAENFTVANIATKYLAEL